MPPPTDHSHLSACIGWHYYFAGGGSVCVVGAVGHGGNVVNSCLLKA